MTKDTRNEEFEIMDALDEVDAALDTSRRIVASLVKIQSDAGHLIQGLDYLNLLANTVRIIRTHAVSINPDINNAHNIMTGYF